MQHWSSTGKVLEQHRNGTGAVLARACKPHLLFLQPLSSKIIYFPHELQGRLYSFATPLDQNQKKTVWAPKPHQLFLLRLSIKSKYFSKRCSFSMLQTMKNRHARTLFHFKLQTLSHWISKTSKRPGGLCSNLRGSATKSVLAV